MDHASFAYLPLGRRLHYVYVLLSQKSSPVLWFQTLILIFTVSEGQEHGGGLAGLQAHGLSEAAAETLAGAASSEGLTGVVGCASRMFPPTVGRLGLAVCKGPWTHHMGLSQHC